MSVLYPIYNKYVWKLPYLRPALKEPKYRYALVLRRYESRVSPFRITLSRKSRSVISKLDQNPFFSFEIYPQLFLLVLSCGVGHFTVVLRG